MTLTTIAIVLIIVWAVGARVKSTLNKTFDLVDETLDGAKAHITEWKETTESTAKLNSLDKKLELEKRLANYNNKQRDDSKRVEKLEDLNKYSF